MHGVWPLIASCQPCAQVATWSSSSKQPQSSKTESFSTHRSLSRWAFTAAPFIFIWEEKQPRCIPYLSCLSDKISWSKKQKRKGLFWLLIWGVVHHGAEEAWETWGCWLHWVCHWEAKWQFCSSPCSCFSVFSPGFQPREWHHSELREAFLPQLT